MKIDERPTVVRETSSHGVVRIALTNADGTVEEFDVSEDLHFLFGLAKCGPNGGKVVSMEIILKGSTTVVGEIFYRIGSENPELLDICARKVMAATRERRKARGIDPGAKEFENAHPVGGTQ